MLANLVQNHDEGELDCAGCQEQFGPCSCGGAIHCEYQETFRRAVIKNIVTGKETVSHVVHAIIVLECDRCDSYEVE